MKSRATLYTIITILSLLLVLSSCETIQSSLDDLNINVESEDVKNIAESAKAVGKSFEDITPEQEYYIGRAVGATILDQYDPYVAEDPTTYINLLGQSLALFSDRPETFGGYHFLILDSDEINAFAAPGGFIFISRGLLRCANSEDAVAAVLAHEIGHVQEKHGLKAIKKSRVSSALAGLAKTTAGTVMTDDQLDDLTTIFDNTIGDITSTLIDSGYSQLQEREADMDAIKILKRSGYNPYALIDLLRVMDKRLKPDGKDFAKTHPDPEDRITYIERNIEESDKRSRASGAKQERYERFMNSI
jgi:predicted Zn-dependent protease